MKPEVSPRLLAQSTLGAAGTTLFLSLLPFALATGRNLEYEYATLSAYLFLFPIPISLLLIPDGLLEKLRPYFAVMETPRGLAALVAGCLLASLLPYASGLTWCACSGREGVFWWATQTAPALLYGLAISFGFTGLRLSGKRPLAVYAGVALVGLILIALLTSMWLAPQKRLIHPLLGFLHGPIYDTWIPVDSGVVLMRMAHFCFALTLMFHLCLRHRWMTGIGFVVTLCLALAGKSYPSTESGFDALSARFQGQLRGSGFILHYVDPDHKGPNTDIQRMVSEAAFHVKDIVELMGKAQPKPVHIFVYPDRTAKKLWFGGGSTDVTDVVTPSIHITADTWPHPTLRHELVHALASSFGFHGLGFHPNMAFTEGLAVALAPEDDPLSLDEGAAALIESGKIPNLSALFSLLFWKEAGARSYTVAGSFIRYLAKTYGLPKVLEAYSGKDWQAAFGKSLDELATEWQAHVMTGFDKEKWQLTSEALYRYPGILNDVCPHSLALLSRAVDKNDFWLNLRRGEDWDPGKDLGPWKDARLAPSRGRDAQTLLSKTRDILKNPSTGATRKAAREKIDGFVGASWQSLEDVELEIAKADLYWQDLDSDATVGLLTQIKDFSARKQLGPGISRQVLARLWFLGHMDRERSKTWYNYVAGLGKAPEWQDSLATENSAEIWMERYLHLRRDTNFVVGKVPLKKLLEMPIPEGIPEGFPGEWARLLAEFAESKNERTDAGNAYAIAVSYARSGQLDLYQMETRKNQWLAQASRPLAQ